MIDLGEGYDNRIYWQDLHSKHSGELRAVGHPFLSEELNQLKYRSETDTVLFCLGDTLREFERMGRTELSIMDVGAGTGYWSGLIQEFCAEQGFSVSLKAVDLSKDALDNIRKRYKNIDTLCVDIKSIHPELFNQSYDLVIAFYCLHHLVNLNHFLNGLQFSGNSVKSRGYLIIMDPVLSMAFSPFNTIDFPSYKGNGIPRHLYLIDDVLCQQGLIRQNVLPAVSFLLNGPIEGRGRLGYSLASKIWVRMFTVYRSGRWVRSLSGVLARVDRLLKRKEASFSSSVCVYRKVSS